MRVLSGKVLVITEEKKDGLILINQEPSRGTVYLSSSDEVEEGEEVLFGENYEEIQIPGKTKAYLMDDANIKLIFGVKNV